MAASHSTWFLDILLRLGLQQMSELRLPTGPFSITMLTEATQSLLSLVFLSSCLTSFDNFQFHILQADRKLTS